MKSAVVRAACRGTTGSQDFTASGVFGGDTPKLAIIMISNATADDTETAESRACIGLVTASAQGCLLYAGTDGAADSAWRTFLADDAVQMRTGANSTVISCSSGSTGLIADGLRIDWDLVTGAGEIVTVLLLGGDDFFAELRPVTMNTTNAVTVNHTLGRTPQALLALCNGFGLDAGGALGAYGYGVYDVGRDVYASVVASRANAAASEACASHYFTTGLPGRIQSGSNSAITWQNVVSAVDSDSLVLTPSATAGTNGVLLLLMAVDGGSIYADGIALPTTTSSTAQGLSLAHPPQAMITLAHQRTATGGDTSSGSNTGLGAGVATKAGGEGCVATLADDSTATMHETCITADEAFRILVDTGGTREEGTVSSWGASDISITMSKANAAVLMPALIFCAADESEGDIVTATGTDVVEVNDSSVKWVHRRRVLDDGFVTSDGSVQSVTRRRTQSDDITFSDGTVSWRRLRRQMGDDLELIDGFVKSLIGAGTVYARVLSDALVIADDIGQRWKFSTVQLTDSITPSDGVAYWARRLRRVSDDIVFDEGVLKIRRYKRALSDDVEIVDELIRMYFPASLYDVRIVIGHEPSPVLGYEDRIKLGAIDTGNILGGY